MMAVARRIHMTRLKWLVIAVAIAAAGALFITPLAFAQQAAPRASAPQRAMPDAAPSDYVIGPEDILQISVWKNETLSRTVPVRPDGKISLPLLNDVDASGRTPEQLRASVTTAASKLIEEPNVTVVVKEINSRVAYITGAVVKAGFYPVRGELTVLQLIAMAGGLAEYADSKNIVVIRKQGGKQTSFKFNYKDVVAQKRPEQNIQLVPGDTVVVP
jgi:polysaccharide biosynthesis/export protein